MKDLQKLYKECLAEATTAGVKPGNIIKVEIGNFKKTYGKTCRDIDTGEYIIKIMRDMLKDEAPEKEVKTTILHEICHTAKDCFNHGPNWKREVNKINKMYGYEIKTKGNMNERNMQNVITFKYTYRCKGCGNIVGYDRVTRFVKNPEIYQCGLCHSKFEKIDPVGSAM